MIRPWYITMKKLKGYFQIFMLSILFMFMHTYARSTGKEAVYILVLNQSPLRANERPQFQCYESFNETTPRTYGRYVYTRNGGEANNLPLLPESQHLVERHAQVINPNTISGQDGFGIFYCQGTQPNKIATTIPTVFLRNDAKLQPNGEVFTKTVNIGDIDVVVEVKRANNDLTNTDLHWRFNGSDASFFSGPGPASLTYTIRGPVSGEHEGVYEVHYYNERYLGRHAIMRLIVRDCIAGRWGPPNCYGICDQCYNGGVCDDLTGKCVCPPGFMGDNCLTGCGGNRFGINCEFRCTNNYDQKDRCRNPIFCLPDPYGCTCNTGFYTLDCVDPCPSGTFGASCTQQCRCTTGTCNPYTGECQGGNVCEAGWSGTSCQIPPVCPNDYFGQQCTVKCHCLNDAPCDKNTGACPNLQCAPGYNAYDSKGLVYCQDCTESTFGHECSGLCHCNAATCNQVTGECDGGCLVNWIEPDCQTGVQSVTNTKVNPGQATVFTCVVTGNPTPTRQCVILERSGGDTTGITFRSKSYNDTSRYVLFDVSQVAAKESIGCRITTPPGAYLIEPSKTFDLPELTTAPTVTDIGGLFVRIEWDEWDGISGDGPVVSYSVHYKLASGSSWLDGDIISNGPMATIEGLRWETPYVFSVAAIREGEGGQGPRGPTSNIVTTLCAEPLPPQGLVAMRNQPKQIVLGWEAPSEDRLRCSTGVLHYTVFYRLAEDAIHQEQSVNTTAAETTIRDLETYSKYNFRVTVRNGIGTSAYSEPLNYFTVEEEPPEPLTPTIISTTLTSITLLLEADEPYNLNGIIKSYEIEYQMVSPTIKDKQYMTVVNMVKDEFSVVANINDLKGNSNYLIRIRIHNGAGGSPWSDNVLATSINSEPVSSATFSTGATIGISVGITATIIFIIIGLLMIVYLKRRGRQSSLAEDGPLESTTGKDMTKTNPYRPNHDNEEYEDIELGDMEYEDVTSSKYEVAWEDLYLAGKILGKGNFGEVQLGRVWIKEKWVKAAIKTLKDGAPESEGILFKKEFDIMVNVGYHQNVVNILGSCDHEDTFYVIIEFVPFGDLRKFLRKSRKNAQQLKIAGNPVSELSPDQLLKFAIDISQGMAHLASCGIIHRDLAARNVLIGNGLRAKVADFGMSRSEDIYVQTSSQRVPTRWLSPESLGSKVYTTKSDVWSFGIVLWEIATFGGTPYPGVETRQLSYKLAEGYRMSKPENCQDDIDEMMLKCWQEKALDRPTFSEIVNVLTHMSAESDTIYMSTNGYQNFKFSPIHAENDGN